jgi:hypothetical protein
MCDGEKDVKKKIDLLYNYMQQNTRYISIQLGIGGWQPFDASYVSQKKYGDCKALTNFMYSLLKEAGIRSLYTLVKAGRHSRYMVEDFPAQQFNHAILSIPLTKDTMWLECTSQTLPTGYMSNMTCNRFALMVDEDGGHLVTTPRYSLKENLQLRKITAVIDQTGKLDADIETAYGGTQQDELFDMITTSSKKEQLEYLKKEIDLPNYDIVSFNYNTQKSANPVVDEKLSITAPGYAQVSGKRLFIQPNLLNKNHFKLKDEERQYDLDLMSEFRDIDSVQITIPDGFTTESIPSAVALVNKFGQYKISCGMNGNKVTMTRLLERKAGSFPPSDYKELVKMYDDIYKADRIKIVLVKKEG